MSTPDKMMHNPGHPADAITDHNEKAFQRAIFRTRETILSKNDIITWIDFELPIDYTKKQSDRLDLIGRDNKGAYVLCEVKFKGVSFKGNPNRGNGMPADACKQIINYFSTFRKQYKFFKFHNTTDPKEKCLLEDSFNPQKVRLMVIANDAYWKDCKNSNSPSSKMKINDAVECYSINIKEDEFFKKQHCKREKYTPELPECSWTRVTKYP